MLKREIVSLFTSYTVDKTGKDSAISGKIPDAAQPLGQSALHLSPIQLCFSVFYSILRAWPLMRMKFPETMAHVHITGRTTTDIWGFEVIHKGFFSVEASLAL